MIVYRVRFKSIISELYLPQKSSGVTLVMLPGLPSAGGKNEFLNFLVHKGITIFQPFFSGSFDSDGSFSAQNCIEDVQTFLHMARRSSQRELYFHKRLEIRSKQLVLGGVSFGGSIAALSSHVPEMDKLLLINPVLEYRAQQLKKLGYSSLKFNHQMYALLRLLKNGYPHSYRIKEPALLDRFLQGKETALQPLNTFLSCKKRTLIASGAKDSVIPPELIRQIMKKQKASNAYKHVIVRHAGHGLSSFQQPSELHSILSFLMD